MLKYVSCAITILTFTWHSPVANAQEITRHPVLSTSDQQRIDQAVTGALAFLASQQRRDGSFAAPNVGQPGITSLCTLAFLAGGHLPDSEPYGERIDKAIDYVRSTQQADGIFFDQRIGSVWMPRRPSHTGIYNHAIAGMMLAELYGMTNRRDSDVLSTAIEQAIGYSRSIQVRFKRRQSDQGGWQYLRPYADNDSDVSVTSWQLMFYRAAKNSGFEVPTRYVDEATDYIRRCFDERAGTFVYRLANYGRIHTLGAAGGGILALSLGGQHDTEIARRTGDWILSRDFSQYNRGLRANERYHYGVFYCSQAMFQLGGNYWNRFYPPIVDVLCRNQNRDGSWDAEAELDVIFGNSYTTALCILALTPPYQTLPLYQR